MASTSCQPTAVTPPAINTTSATQPTNETEQQIVDFCSGCHAMPKPMSFPQSAWYDEVKRGFDFYHQSARKDLSPPPVQTVVEYFRRRAPKSLVVPKPDSEPGPSRLRFRPSEMVLPTTEGISKPAAVSFVAQWPGSETSSKDLLVSDMAAGGVWRWQPLVANRPPQKVAALRNPAVARFVDLNGNGEPDLVVADLGSFSPADHDRGRVVWLPDVGVGSSAQQGTPLIEGLGRVADVQPTDFDGDGDTDFVVAEFGWHKTGRVIWLRNDGNATSPKFELDVLDPRPGAIHVPVTDLNRDGRPDVVALISQEFEVIEAFLNRGDGTFEKARVHAADDPSFGSSGIQLIDMDGDGDEDVLSANGDTFDSKLLKPYHGIQWLENTGGFPFVPHRLTSMPGVHRVLAGDLDGDGDLDIVAGALLPTANLEEAVSLKLHSLIWLEQREPGKFIRHAIETANCVHATLELADFDGDGDLDIATGSFRDRGSVEQSAVTLWWNERR
ncbi:MAG: VCBS repeat-containing protein [Planctomycetota bacterium]